MPTKPATKPAAKPAPTTPQHRDVYAALCAAQAKFPVLGKAATGQVGNQRYKYLTYDEMVKAVVPVLTAEGLCYFHLISDETNGDYLTLETCLVYTGKMDDEGQNTISSVWPLQPDRAGPQAMGSAITYGKRYTLGAILGIAAEEDDDGAAAQGKPGSKSFLVAAPITQKQIVTMGECFTEIGWDANRQRETLDKVTKGRTNNATELYGSEATTTIKRLRELIEEAKESMEESPDEPYVDDGPDEPENLL